MKHVDISDLILDTSNREKHSYSFQYLIIIITTIITILFIISIFKDNNNPASNNKLINIPKNNIIQNKIEKKIISKKVEKVIIKENNPIISHPNNIETNTKLRYIQVGIFKNEINKKQLTILNENNFKFIKRKGNKFSKILIGPYDNYKAATLDLKLIKSKFRKDSFITK